MKILHTSDWQLGLKLRFIAGESGARARALRFETVREIADIAKKEKVDAVLVAGDVFDDNTVGGDTLQLAIDALARFKPVPVFLLPGNHDHAVPGGILSQLAERDLPSITCCLDTTPLELSNLTIHPCPLTERRIVTDPTEHLEEVANDARIHIALAHGGAIDFGALTGSETETGNIIDIPAILKKGFDYVALGDWHGLFKYKLRAWYSGTHEGTRFKEKEIGNVLIVEIAEHGADPVVTPRPVARTRWITHKHECSEDKDVDVLDDWLNSLDEVASTLVKLELTGHCSLEGRIKLDKILENNRERLMMLEVDDQVQETPSDEDLDRMRVPGFANGVITELREATDPISQRALRLAFRFLREGGQSS